ncbi:single-stranded DNA-binding protein [Anatilimnocola floriformis]|uniref:single-stranded DNA-binding protein n=1 Tax=Anatilimnocola floriformis TaxID=2948575 RepID=UPI0020C590F6|nr:single-stranded DNA-binding protein [Anatilimnocola floriformis]
MASFNRVILLGNITRDIEVKHLQSGMAVTEITLAVNDRRKDQSGSWIEETTFVDVTLWGRQAEICAEYLGKGSPILIEGRLKLDQWEKDGQKRSKLRVVGEKMQLMPTGGAKGGGGGRGGNRGGMGDDGPGFDESEYGGESFSAPAPRGGGGGRSQPSPPPSDDIPF